jgi:hypothetical protein
MRVARWIGVAIATIAALGPQTGAVQVSWSLAPPGCSGPVTVIEIQCGDYGVFTVGGAPESTTSGCAPSVISADDPLYYPPPYTLDPFPHPAQHLRDSGGGGPMETKVRRVPPSRKVNLIGKAPGPSPPPTPPPQAPPPWIAVIDFSGAHGDSTTWFAGEIAGPTVDTRLADLDDAALDELGENVGDFHVLAQLCAIAEVVDDEGRNPPLVVNMSFGRAQVDTDPLSGASCTEGRVSCQIAKVISHLRARHTSFVAAAGNRRELLFPASLPDVLAVGMLDVGLFLSTGAAEAMWETPEEGVEGLAPGNALCVGYWAVPAGSSYSSAVMAGWLAEYLQSHPNAEITGGEPWVPSLDEECYLLTRGTTVGGSCNAAIGSVFGGLEGGNMLTCWNWATAPSETVPPPDVPILEPAIPSLDTFASGEHPTPEPDPCVPCVGVGVGEGGGGGGGEESLTVGVDLVIDLSQSHPVPAGTQLDGVSLRVGTDFYPLALTPEQIDALESGSLAQLVLSDAYPLLGPIDQPSLWYKLRPVAETTCHPPAECFWSSTPILIRQE